MLTCTLRTNTSYHVVDSVYDIPIRQLHLRYGRVNTEGALTSFAIKMHMHIIMFVMIVTSAQFISHTIAAGLYGMYHMVLTEKSQSS